MSVVWTIESATNFWNRRNCNLVLKENNLLQKKAQMLTESEERASSLEAEFQKFVSENQHKFSPATLQSIKHEKTVSNLKFWIEFSSWTFCSKCSSLQREKLLPRHEKRPERKFSKKCPCMSDRYLVPDFSVIPECLKCLTFPDICVIRPFILHQGDYVRLQHGYQQKNGITRVSWKEKTVNLCIEQLQDETQKQRCSSAYAFLMACTESSYRHFVELHTRHLGENNKQVNIYMLAECRGIECALWPHLYPFTSWCETTLTGQQSRLSRKIGFLTKVFSGIVDYSLEYELLQFHYDLWIFTTVSGALSSGRIMRCSPARALNAKTFSTGYWKMQHRLLLDAVYQFGYPSLFITINPYEWTFPFPKWLSNIRDMTGRGPTALSGFETIHIAHVLEQLVRGYLTGTNQSSWKKHILSYGNRSAISNINTYYYRFEFQQRGTVHLHLLVWLKNISETQFNLMRGDIPYENKELAFLVKKLQPSDKDVLPLNNNATSFETINDKKVLHISHPAESFAMNLRGYIETILPTLSCRMDVQTTDGKGMILRYVTSYVSKWHDAFSNDALYSTHVAPYQAAYVHVKQMKPCEPEMWLHLASIKMSWTCSRTKEYIVPLSSTIGNNTIHAKYLTRPRSMTNLSFLMWLRTVNATKSNCLPYKSGSTLVSIKMVSPFNDEYFFQHLLMNHPHNATAQLFHPQLDELPCRIKFFASAVKLNSTFWNDLPSISEYFEKQGNKSYYVETLCAYIRSLHNTMYLWQKRVLSSTQLNSECPSDITYSLDNFQNMIFLRISLFLQCRDEYYTSDNLYTDSDDEHDENNSEHNEHSPANHNPRDIQTFWRKFVLITGRHGTGKSQTICHTISTCIEQQRKVLVAAPTGILAARYRNMFGTKIDADTVHSAFHFPVNPDEHPTINWNISSYDIVIIDEISMIPKTIFDHIIRTMQQIPIRPILVLAGDVQQQQPIETMDGKICQVESILSEPRFMSIVEHYKLTQQYRVLDEEYEKFIQHIRYWRPTQQLLDQMQQGRVICQQSEPTDDEIYHVVSQNPDSTVLTVSKRACHKVNQAVIARLFAQKMPLAHVQCDNEETTDTPIYKDMRVIITQNRDKSNGVVNGQEGTVHCIENETIFLKLANGKIVSVYPVTYKNLQNVVKSCYPLMPSYALTITKSQGMNLNTVIIWFDCNKLPTGSAYVALSRIRRGRDLILLTPMLENHVTPVTIH